MILSVASIRIVPKTHYTTQPEEPCLSEISGLAEYKLAQLLHWESCSNHEHNVGDFQDNEPVQQESIPYQFILVYSVKIYNKGKLVRLQIIIIPTSQSLYLMV